ncbi:hypothetical protein [Pseudomonas sp. JL3]|uniref:hypothetical protein n=1 Tax=Pseudomonas sp. JL3 TaxID=2919943 RepID=UPI002861961B|nr:hypothetical protein [Pseudomonas sp. JL3]MDR8364064.1 hypothetical protein [Pseudomonas sp. JL3]
MKKSMYEIERDKIKAQMDAEQTQKNRPLDAETAAIISLAEWEKMHAFPDLTVGLALRFSKISTYQDGDAYNLEPFRYTSIIDYASRLRTTIDFSRAMIENKESEVEYGLILTGATTKANKDYMFTDKRTLYKCEGLGNPSVLHSFPMHKDIKPTGFARSIIISIINILPSKPLPTFQ